MLKTILNDILGIEYPIFQGAMAWISGVGLAAAVSEAGGLGVLATAGLTAPELRAKIQHIRRQTSRPFGVNIMLLSRSAAQLASVVAEEQVPVVTTGAGQPGKFMAGWLKAGIKVIPVIASARVAKRMADLGAAAVVAEGTEAGGHIGELTTMALVPQVVDAVDIPVLAAGGIGDGRGLAAALMLGAAGVQMGTRFLAARECDINRVYKDKVLKATDSGTLALGRRHGHPIRALKTPFARHLYTREYDSSVSADDYSALQTAGLRAALLDGDSGQGCFMAGQIAGLVNKEQTAAEIITEISAEAETLLCGAQTWVR